MELLMNCYFLFVNYNVHWITEYFDWLRFRSRFLLVIILPMVYNSTMIRIFNWYFGISLYSKEAVYCNFIDFISFIAPCELHATFKFKENNVSKCCKCFQQIFGIEKAPREYFGINMFWEFFLYITNSLKNWCLYIIFLLYSLENYNFR